MELQKTIDYLTEFRKNSENSTNRKYSEKFIRLLSEMQSKEMDALKESRLNSELQLILQNFEIEKSNVQVKKELKKFIQFLKSEFSITVSWHYTQLGVLCGLIATVFLGTSMLSIGLLVGGAVGYMLDEKAKKEGKKLKTQLNELSFY